MMRRMRHMPLRARLALMTAVAVAIAIAGVSTACWFLTRDQLMSQMDRSLRETPVLVRGPQSQIDVCSSIETGNSPPPFVRLDENGKTQMRETTQVILADGSVCTQRYAYTVPASQSDLAVARGEQREAIHNATAENGVHMRVFTRLVITPDNPTPAYAFSIARPLTDIDNSLENLALWLIVVSGIGVVVAASTGVLVARTALKPVDNFTDVVEHIARTEDLDTQIPVEGKDEIARLSTSFNAMTGALKASRERQQQLIADAGHELRTPLTSLRTNTDLLLMSEEQGRPLPTADKQRLLRNVRGQLRELSGLVGDLLQLARPDRSRNAPATGVAALHTAAEHAVERAKLRGQNVVFAVDLQPWYVRGEEQELERAVLNLLDNAVKFGPDDGTIEIRLKDGELTVHDHGPGVDPEDAPHVFERFWRSASARALPGSGLGLAIVARTVRESGGSVRSASCFCNSRPLTPGNVTSSTRQLGTVGRGESRNRCADSNTRGCQPALSSSGSSDSRTETSSSTTNTMPVTSGMEEASTSRAAIDGLTVYGRRITSSRETVAMFYLSPSAASTASINEVSIKGFTKHTAAPSARRRSWRDLSSFAVMKTIGTGCPRCASSC
jgi:two-component system sensor histidine kinase MprB